MKKTYLLIFFYFFAITITHAQSVGINLTGAAPNVTALLHVDAGSSSSKGILVTGTYNGASTIPNLGAGSRLMYYPGKVAFRAGYVSGTQWDNANVGLYSVALGNSTTANGYNSTAMGNATTASGYYATAMGGFTTASSYYSTAMGYSTTASGDKSTAMGVLTTANGDYSTAIGYGTVASGLISTAIGYNSTASGDNSFAIGKNVSTNNHAGAFFLGDSDPSGKPIRTIGTDDQFAARFNGGYYLISSDYGANDMGVQILPGGNAWISVCDKNRKENFEPIDGDDVLRKIAKINFTSWNCKLPLFSTV